MLLNRNFLFLSHTQIQKQAHKHTRTYIKLIFKSSFTWNLRSYLILLMLSVSLTAVCVRARICEFGSFPHNSRTGANLVFHLARLYLFCWLWCEWVHLVFWRFHVKCWLWKPAKAAWTMAMDVFFFSFPRKKIEATFIRQ